MRATIGVVTYRSFDKVRRDAEAYRRLTGLRSTQDGYDARHGTSPEEMARAIEAIALEVERIRDEPRPAPSNREVPLTASMPNPDNVNAFAAADPPAG